MKAATGELNLTVITIVAIGAVIAFFFGVLWPHIQESINSSWDDVDTQYDDEGNRTSMIVPSESASTYTNGSYTITF